MIDRGERQRKVRKVQGCGWGSSEVEKDVTAPALLQRSAVDSDSEQISDSESVNDEVLVSEGGELEEVDESAFGKLVAGAVEQSRCVIAQVLGAKANFCRETSFGRSTVLRYQQGSTPTKRHQRRLRQQLPYNLGIFDMWQSHCAMWLSGFAAMAE